MTISSTINRSGPYTGNGVTTSFPYSFQIAAASHLMAVQTVGDEDTTINASAYTITGVGQVSGGVVVFSSPPAAGVKVTFLRNIPFTQLIDLENQGAYYAETVEGALDLAVMRDQMLLERINRADLAGVTGGGSSGGGGGGSLSWNAIQDKPTTIAGFGITDAYTKAEVNSLVGGGGSGSIPWSRITGTPTTLAGYGITDGGSGTGAKPSLRIKSLWDYGADGLGGTNDQNAYVSARAAAGVNMPVISDTGDFRVRAVTFNPYGDDYRTDSGTGFSLYQGNYLSSDSTSTVPYPIIRLDKVSGMNQSTGRVWDVGALEINYEKRAGNAYASGLSVMATHSGGENDLVAGHFRTTINTKGTGGRGWAVWGYVTNNNDTLTPWHAAEFNGCNQGIDPGYLGQAQLVRLCMSDISDAGNRMSAALVIGKSTHGGNNGFYTGIRVEADAIIPTSDYQADGDAMRIDGPASGGNIGGLRLTGRVKFGLKTLEATVSNGAAVWMAAGQKIVWGDAAGQCSIQSSPSADAIDISTNVKVRDLVIASGKKLYFTDGSGPNISQSGTSLNFSGGIGATALSIAGAYISNSDNTAAGTLNFVNQISTSKGIAATGAISSQNAISAQGDITTPSRVQGGQVNAGTLQVDSTANFSVGINVNGTKVLGARQPGTAVLGPSSDMQTIRNVVNHLRTILENHGIIAANTGTIG